MQEGKEDSVDAMNEPSVKRCIENPSSEFDVNRLSEQ